jgi:DTW domain-containing protein
MKRVICQRCDRPATNCICGLVKPLVNSIEVLLLQHPLEASNYKGSAKLLSLSLLQCRVVVGELFEPAKLKHLLCDPWPDSTVQEPSVPVLLYPNSELIERKSKPMLDVRRLVVLDATWRKSRKMLYLNPMLLQLPRLELTNPARSRYSIRKAHKENQRSTLEATCAALSELEGGIATQFEPLLVAFDHFVKTLAAQAGNGESLLL